MKVLFLTNLYPDNDGFRGGIFVHNIAKAVQFLNTEVEVAFIDLRSIRKKRKIGYSSYSFNGIHVHRFAFPCGPIFPLNYWLETLFAKMLLKKIIAKTGKPTIVHAHFWPSGYDASRICNKYGIPYIVTEHGSDILCDSLNRYYKKKAKFAYDNAKAIISVSKSLARQISQITDKTICVIPNTIPDYMFANNGFEDRKKDSTFKFISVGNLIADKRFDLLIDAFYEFSKSNESISLDIVGEGPEKKYLLSIIQKYGLNEKVKLLGKKENYDLPRLYSNSDCFVLVSEYETFGVVFIEAMANGLPVIATECGGPKEIVCENNGILVPRNDEEKLVEAMKKIVKNREKYNNNRIRSNAYKKYSYANIGKQLKEIYDETIANA